MPQALCTFDNGASFSAAVPAGGALLAFAKWQTWRKFTGAASGLWRPGGGPLTKKAQRGRLGLSPDDVFVLAHNGSTGELTAWNDLSAMISDSPDWDFGAGSAAGSGLALKLTGHDFAGPTHTTCAGVLSADASRIAWKGKGCGDPRGDGVLQWARKRDARGVSNHIHSVHLVFMNHLDIGYTNFAVPVYNEYLHEYYTRAINISQTFREAGGTDRYIYGTHPFLMSLFLECPPHMDLSNPRANASLLCPSAAERAAFEAAIRRGDIFWNGIPFNLQPENTDPQLFDAGLRMAQGMDRRFNRSATRTASIRDVIYTTRAAVPRLARAGIDRLTIGSNGACYPLQVPKLHRWRDAASDTELTVAYHPYGYGGYSRADCAEAPNGHALCTAFRSDNQGPEPTWIDVLHALDWVRGEYPEASVFSSTFDDFFDAIEPVSSQLPVVEAEAGDTWIYGTASDPLKFMQYREIVRAWTECLEAGEPRCAAADPTVANMTRWLLKAPEHTWGLPGIAGWGGGDDYNKTSFLTNLTNANFMDAAASWAEQRYHNEMALVALEVSSPPHPLAASARARVEALSRVVAPELSGLSRVPAARATATGWSMRDLGEIGFDASGAIVQLDVGGTSWASNSARLASLSYRTFGESDWEPFTYDYLTAPSAATLPLLCLCDCRR